MPGPASSVVERSLRNISTSGDRGSNLAEGFIFSDELQSRNAIYVWGNFQLSDGTINHATYRKEAVATSLLSERERSPNKSTL